MPRGKENRLRQVQRYDASDPNDATTIADYEYDGKNRRTQKVVTNSGVEDVPNDGGNTTLHYYYDNRWRIIEERNGSSETVRQYVWGTRYTDELICIDINGDASNGNDCDPDVADPNDVEADARYFVHQDRNWNVQALTAYSPDPNDPNTPTNGQVVERYTIAPYGTFTVLKGAASGDNEADARLTSLIGNVFAHQGLPFDAEKGGYQNRWREYHAPVQRFDQPDPLGYRDGTNLYAYLHDSPTATTDWSGLGTVIFHTSCSGFTMPGTLGGLPAVCLSEDSNTWFWCMSPENSHIDGVYIGGGTLDSFYKVPNGCTLTIICNSTGPRRADCDCNWFVTLLCYWCTPISLTPGGGPGAGGWPPALPPDYLPGLGLGPGQGT